MLIFWLKGFKHLRFLQRFLCFCCSKRQPKRQWVRLKGFTAVMQQLGVFYTLPTTPSQAKGEIWGSSRTAENGAFLTPQQKIHQKNSEKKSDYQVTFTDSRGLWVQVKSGCLHTHLGNSNRRGTPSGVLSANTTKPLHLKKHYYHTDIFLNSIAEATEKKKKSQSIFIFLLEPKSLGVLKFLNFCAF